MQLSQNKSKLFGWVYVAARAFGETIVWIQVKTLERVSGCLHFTTNSMVAIGDKVEIFWHEFYSVSPVTQEKLGKNPRTF